MRGAMSNANAALTVFDSPHEIAAVIRQVQAINSGAKSLSIVWRDQQSSSEVTGYYKSGTHIKCWGELESQWNEIFEAISGWAIVDIPDIGRVLIVGPLSDWIANALANAAIFGGMSAIGMGLYSVGISRKSIHLCEEALKEGKCVLLVNGSAKDVEISRQVIGEFCQPGST
jgi:hypothetical protein